MEFKKGDKWFKGIIISVEPMYVLGLNNKEFYIDSDEIYTKIRSLSKHEPIFNKLHKLAEAKLNKEDIIKSGM